MDQIHTYIEEVRKKGKSDDEIKSTLIAAGWQKNTVEAAFHSPADILPPPPAPPKNSTNATGGLTSAWDAFEHVLLFISLYVLATSIGLILHYFVDKWVPGVRLTSYVDYGDWQATLFRGYMAALIVSLPLFTFFFLNITSRTNANIAIRGLHARKVLIYITLVGTFIIMIASIIRVVFNMLNGNLSSNFILHLIVTLTVSGVIFIYYLNQVKEDRKIHA